MANGLVTRTQFQDTFLENALPMLRAVTMNEYESFGDQYTEIYNVEDSDRAIEQFTEVTGFPIFQEINEGEPVHLDAPLEGFNKTYRHRKFGLGYQVTQEAIDDDKHRIIRSFAQELGRAARETVESEAVLPFDRAFNASYTGPDGQTLCSTAHPNVRGGTQANRPATDVDLDLDSLEAALTTFRGWTDHDGKKVRIVPVQLVVPSALEFTAAETLNIGLDYKTGGPDLTINPLRHRNRMKAFQDYFVWDYLADPDAWFVLGQKERLKLRYFWRKRFNTQSDHDIRSDSVITVGRMRFVVGFDGWQGVYGTSGAS